MPRGAATADFDIKDYWCHCQELKRYPHFDEDHLRIQKRSTILECLTKAQLFEERFGEEAFLSEERQKRKKYEQAASFSRYQTNMEHNTNKPRINYKLLYEMLDKQIKGR